MIYKGFYNVNPEYTNDMYQILKSALQYEGAIDICGRGTRFKAVKYIIDLLMGRGGGG